MSERLANTRLESGDCVQFNFKCGTMTIFRPPNTTSFVGALDDDKYLVGVTNLEEARKVAAGIAFAAGCVSALRTREYAPHCDYLATFQLA